MTLLWIYHTLSNRPVRSHRLLWLLSDHESALGIPCLCTKTSDVLSKKMVLPICCLTCYLSSHDKRNRTSSGRHKCEIWLDQWNMCILITDSHVNVRQARKRTRFVNSRMLSVLSCMVSVLRRLSASMKAPVSTVSSSMVAHRSCSATDSSLHAASDRTCRRLFTVSTMACRREKKRDVSVPEVRDDF